MRERLLWLGVWLGLVMAVVSFVLMMTSAVLTGIEKPGKTAQKTVALKTELTQVLTDEGFRIEETDEKEFERAKKDYAPANLDYDMFISLADGFAKDKLVNKTLVKTEVDDNNFLQPKDVYWFLNTIRHTKRFILIAYADRYDTSPPPEMPDFDEIRFVDATTEGIVLEYFAYPYFVWPGFYFYLGGMLGWSFFAVLCVSLLSSIRRNQKKLTQR